MNKEDQPILLTQFSRGAGCGCKIAPQLLQEMLQKDATGTFFPSLLVGNETNDDAAVLDIGNGQAIISTTDFFMPIVDDAFDFGRIAAANAISDVYAMGGKPLMALAILGWPVEKLPASLAKKVLDGARAICEQAGIPLAGGHSIDSTEPVFGLAVTGITSIEQVKKNNAAKAGDMLFLTKPIGTGILSTAQKRKQLREEHLAPLISNMTSLNSFGEKAGAIAAITAMTDVTGFGLLGHLIEMAEGAGLSAELFYQRIPVLPGAKEYLTQRIVPDATYRNWNSYSTKVAFEKGVNVMEAFNLLPDPQTNGGLLISVSPKGITAFQEMLDEQGFKEYVHPIGILTDAREKTVLVKNQDN